MRKTLEYPFSFLEHISDKQGELSLRKRKMEDYLRLKDRSDTAKPIIILLFNIPEEDNEGPVTRVENSLVQ